MAEHMRSAVAIKLLHKVFFHLFNRTILWLNHLLFIVDFYIQEGIVRSSGLLGLACLS